MGEEGEGAPLSFCLGGLPPVSGLRQQTECPALGVPGWGCCTGKLLAPVIRMDFESGCDPEHSVSVSQPQFLHLDLLHRNTIA